MATFGDGRFSNDTSSSNFLAGTDHLIVGGESPKNLWGGGRISTGDKRSMAARDGCSGNMGCGRPSRGGKGDMGRVL
jgi:hypothetical protein